MSEARMRDSAVHLALMHQCAADADLRARAAIALAPAKRRAAADTARAAMSERTPPRIDTARLRQARRLFGDLDAPLSTRRSYMRQWARMLRLLGDKWLGLNRPGQRITSPTN